MASARSFAFSALRSNITRQCRGAVVQRQFQNGLVKAQPIQRALRPAFVPVRWHSAPSERSKDYDFSQIKEFTSSPSPERLLIDVREPSEYEAGFIPGAINIPVKSQPDAMFLPEEEFEDRFGFSKPAMDKELVFYCKAGVRSSAAASLAKQVGYQNVAEYRGSWMDWEKNGGQTSKP
ncbi:hypothetical protein Q7P37_011578 [Cladosporium fusiforme]